MKKKKLGLLKISHHGTKSSADPEEYDVKKGDSIPVEVRGRCRVCFDRTDILYNRNHEDGETPTWTPHNGAGVTVYYTIIDYGKRCPGEHIERTYSIKIGS